MRKETSGMFATQLAECFILLVFLLLLIPAGAASESDLPTDKDLKLIENWTGDLDGMVERRSIRALVVISKTNYLKNMPAPMTWTGCSWLRSPTRNPALIRARGVFGGCRRHATFAKHSRGKPHQHSRY